MFSSSLILALPIVRSLSSRPLVRYGLKVVSSADPLMAARGFSSSSSMLLPHHKLAFNSIQINADESLKVADISEFASRLSSTISEMQNAGVNAIYIKCHIAHAKYITTCGMYGFKFHRAEGDDAYMLRWLPETECKVPPFATHSAGVGALIIDDGQVLVVKEKSKIAGWKMPGGYVDLGEDLSAAAEREVREETGVAAKFQSVLRVRHSHNQQWGRSDLYFVCRMKALSRDIKVDAEIDDACWMSIAEFNQVNKHSMMKDIMLPLEQDPGLFDSPDKLRSVGFEAVTLDSIFPGREPFKFYKPA